MPSAEQIKHLLTGVLLPVGVGAAVTWLFATTHIFNLFGITEGQVAGELTLLGTWVVGTIITWLTQHHILKATYTPTAKLATVKARAERERV